MESRYATHKWESNAARMALTTSTYHSPHPEYTEPLQQDSVRWMQTRCHQVHQDTWWRCRLLSQLLLQPRLISLWVSRHQSLGLSTLRQRLDCRRRASTVRRPLKVLVLLSRHGFGNWAEIADFIATNKTREDVEDHYLTTYLEAPSFLPVHRLSYRTPLSYQEGTPRAGS